MLELTTTFPIKLKPLFDELSKKYYCPTRIHSRINKFFAGTGHDIRVYKVRGKEHYVVKIRYFGKYQYITSNCPDHAVDNALKLVIRRYGIPKNRI